MYSKVNNSNDGISIQKDICLKRKMTTNTNIFKNKDELSSKLKRNKKEMRIRKKEEEEESREKRKKRKRNQIES